MNVATPSPAPAYAVPQPPAPTAATPYAAPRYADPLPRRTDAFPLPGFELARPGIRLLARIIDNAIYYAPILATTWVISNAAGDELELMIAVAIASSIAFVFLQIVQAVLVTKIGATIGKRLVGIKIIRHDGGEAGFVEGWLVRTFLYGVIESALAAFCLSLPHLADALMVFTRHGQTLHDRMAGTYVVKAHSAAGSR